MSTEILRPNGVGSETSIDTQYPDSGAHWEKVDEETPDDDSTYVENKNGAHGVFQRDLYSIPNSSVGVGIITSVRVYIRCKSNVPQDAKASIRTHDIIRDSDSLTSFYTWITASKTWETNPFTGNAWTWDEINALEIGVSTCGSTYAPDWSKCTQVYVEITYGLPAVTTQAVTDIQPTTATGNGNITDLGSPNPTAYGVCYNTTGNPTTGDDHTDEGAASETGAFTTEMTALTAGTKHYVRAYVTNEVGTSYGAEVSFTTFGLSRSQVHFIG